MPALLSLDFHYAPENLHCRIAFGFIRFLRLGADLFFQSATNIAQLCQGSADYCRVNNAAG
jgi:hypothetical protein